MLKYHIRRISIFGGPNTGKTTIATFLFSALKAKNYDCEYIYEYVKQWTYIKREVTSYDGVYIFSKQLHLEDTVLSGGVGFVITDSPLFLSYFYSQENGAPCADNILGIIKEFEKDYPSLNILLTREEDKPYDEKGRFHTYTQAIDIDNKLKQSLNRQNILYKTFSFSDNKKIIKYIIENLK